MSPPDRQPEMGRLAHVSSPVHWLSPSHLRAAAHLYGVATAPLEKARVLEVGCTLGGNLLPFAISQPSAEVVGVDACAAYVDEGAALAARLGLGNLHLLCGSWQQIGEELGQFDYIVVNGVYDSVDEAERAALLQTCAARLSERGILCVRYNTYPGWKAGDALRDALLFHAQLQGGEDPVGAGRTMLRELAVGMPDSNALLSGMLKLGSEAGASEHVLHEQYLANARGASYLIEFAGVAAQAGLAFAGDAQPQIELAASYGERVEQAHERLAAGQPAVVAQQYLDFLAGTASRSTLLIRAERAAEPLPAPDLQRLADLRVAGCYAPVGPADGIKAGRYQGRVGSTVTTPSLLASDVAETLTAVWPRSLAVQELVSAIAIEGIHEVQTSAVEDVLRGFFRAGALRYSLDPSPYDDCPAEGIRPIPGVLETVIAELEQRPIRVSSFNLWHEEAKLGFSTEQLLLLSEFGGNDGHVAIEAQLERDIVQDVYEDPAGRAGSPDRRAAEGYLQRLRSAAVVNGSRAGWADFASTLFRIGDKTLPGVLRPLMAMAIDAPALATSRKLRKGAETPASRAAHSAALRVLRDALTSGSEERVRTAAADLTERFPHEVLGWIRLSASLLRTGRPEEAADAAVRGLVYGPSEPLLYGNVATGLQTKGQLLAALTAYRLAVRLEKPSGLLYSNLGVVLTKLGMHTPAAEAFRLALAENPKDVDARNNMAELCVRRGLHVEAFKYYDDVLKEFPEQLTAHTNRLYAAAHRDDLSPDQVFELHLAFGRVAARRASGISLPRLSNDKDPNRRLRVGFVSGDLRNHAVARFFEPVWQQLDRSKFELHLFSASAIEDAVSERFRATADGWHSVRGMSDEKAVKLVRKLNIDILFDLSGHTAHNRLTMFAHRAAPVQVTWIGYPGTTGLDTMDYALADKHAMPPGLFDSQYVEDIVYLPMTWAFNPGVSAIPVSPLPALGNGYLTFGSMNRRAKITPATLDVWSAVMCALPSARLIVGAMDDEWSESELSQALAARGVELGRISFERRADLKRFYELHHQIDISLDTFPYTGGTTTCHGLWMGVPVLTKRGLTRASWQSTAILSRLGMMEAWSCGSTQDLVNAAIGWANRLDELASVRAALRGNVERVAMQDDGRVARSLEAAILEMWRRWVHSTPRSSFSVS